MNRITVNLSDAQYDYVEEFAEETDSSLSSAVAAIIDSHRGADALLDAPMKHDASGDASDDALAELRDRVSRLEDAIDELQESSDDAA
jgi:cell division septum initiation protein DivIVA